MGKLKSIQLKGRVLLVNPQFNGKVFEFSFTNNVKIIKAKVMCFGNLALIPNPGIFGGFIGLFSLRSDFINLPPDNISVDLYGGVFAGGVDFGNIDLHINDFSYGSSQYTTIEKEFNSGLVECFIDVNNPYLAAIQAGDYLQVELDLVYEV
jgi:hypothetical protein